MVILKSIFNWLGTKEADKFFAIFFAAFTVIDLLKGYYWSAFFDALIVAFSVWDYKRKAAKGK